MKKIIIPTILTATILIAGMFAIMPVQKASTVHTTITSQLCTALYGLAVCPVAETPVESNVAAGGATSTNVNAQDRVFTFDLGTNTADDNDNILIPAKALKNLEGRVTVSAANAVVGELCLVQSTDDATTIATTTANTAETVQANFNTATPTPAGFTTGEGIQIDAGAGVQCRVSIFLDSVTGE